MADTWEAVIEDALRPRYRQQPLVIREGSSTWSHRDFAHIPFKTRVTVYINDGTFAYAECPRCRWSATSADIGAVHTVARRHVREWTE